MIYTEKEQALFAQNVGKLLKYVFSEGYECTINEVYRTPEQAALNERTCKGVANSLHCHRLAIDINLFDRSIYERETNSYEKIGVYWESLNPHNRWGGRFTSRPDGNHFEYCPWQDRKEEHATHATPTRHKELITSYDLLLPTGGAIVLLCMLFYLSRPRD